MELIHPSSCRECADYSGGNCDVLISFLSKQRRNPTKQDNAKKPAQKDFSNKFFQPILPSSKTAERARLANEARLWRYRLRTASKKDGITLSPQQANDLARLLELMPLLLESEAIAENGVRQARRVDEAEHIWHADKTVAGLRKACISLGWGKGKKEPEVSDELIIQEYLYLIKRYGKTTKGKQKAVEEVRKIHFIQSYEATLKRLQRARKRLLKETQVPRHELDGILPPLWPKSDV